MLPQGSPLEIKDLQPMSDWSDTGTQAQKTKIHISNNMALEQQECTTTQTHGQGLKDKV